MTASNFNLGKWILCILRMYHEDIPHPTLECKMICEDCGRVRNAELD